MALNSITTNKYVVFEYTEDSEDQKTEEDENKLFMEISENNIDYGLNERQKYQKLTIQQNNSLR